MAYACPKCSGPVQRGSSAVAGHAGGLVGALLFSAFAGFECNKCGKIPRSEFPADVQSQMTRNSALMVLGALGVLAGVAALLVAIQ